MIIVTIPAYNEAKTLGKVISEIKSVMGEKQKILVVDDGSTDNTAAVAKKSGAIVVSHPHNMGLAQTFRTEMKKCLELKADKIVHIDSDGQYDARDIPALLKELKNSDLVLGSRFAGEIEYMPLIKRIGNIAFSKVISHITGEKVSDGQTGFRAFNRAIAQLEIRSEYTYTQEQIIESIKEGFVVNEVPVRFRKRKGHSHLIKNPLQYALKAWITILRTYRDFEPLKFFGNIGGVFLVIGAVLGLYFIQMHFRTGIQGHLPLMIFMILMIITGLQIMVFGFLADMKRRD